MLLFSPAHASWLMRSTTAAATKTAILVLTFRDSIALLLFSIHARRSNASAGLALFDPRPLIDDIWNFTLDLVAGGLYAKGWRCSGILFKHKVPQVGHSEPELASGFYR